MKLVARPNLEHPLMLLAGAFLYIIAYNEPDIFWMFGLVALVPFLFLIERTRSFKQVFWHGVLFGAIVSGGVLSWFLSAYPLDWAGIENSLIGLTVTLFVWAVSAISLGVFFGFWALFFKKVSRGNWWDVLLAPSLWIIFELSRAFFSSVVFAGGSSSYGPYWTFGFLGYPLSWSKTFVLLAPLGGVYLLGFIGVAFNVVIFNIIKNLRERLRNKILALLVVAMLVSEIVLTVNTKASDNVVSPNSIIVAVVSTNFPPPYSEGLLGMGKKAQAMKNNLSLASEFHPDIIVLPEDSQALISLGTSTVDKLLGDNRNVILLDSSAAAPGGKIKERMVFYRPGDKRPETEDKHFLIPYGEYLPYHAAALASLLGQSSWVREFEAARGYGKGNEAGIHQFKEDSFGALFCSEVIPENFYRKLAEDGAGLFFNVSSQDIFRGNNVLYKQTLSLAKMKAASNRRYFVSAGNFSPSFVINDKGGIVVETKKGQNEILVRKVGFNYDKTPYTRFGDWVLWLAGFIIAVAIVKRKDL